MLRNFMRATTCAAVLLTTIIAQSAMAQLTPSLTALRSTVYRLLPSADYTQGCFPPCLCPIMHLGTVRGTMVLTPAPTPAVASTVFDYHVDDVNWLVAQGVATEHRVTGSGMLRRIGAPTPGAQRLELDLTINDQDVQYFDSGWVQPTVAFPQIDLAVSLNGMVCFDTVFRVAAVPVPTSQILPYQLALTSTHQVGCWPPCLCPLQSPQPITGTFWLVPIVSFSPTGQPPAPGNEYAVVNVRWNVLSPTTVVQSYRGFGFYRRNVPGPWLAPLPGQHMFVDLRTSLTGDLIHFDSGIVPATVQFPTIDVAMSINGMVCFDTVIDLQASPVTPAASVRGGP